MKTFLICCLCIVKGFSLSISPENAKLIGEKIWMNECAGSIDGLTHWNQGENFPSLGIGHFIWYSRDQREGFQETFPDLLAFVENQGASLPAWLKTVKGCPWNSREEFYAKFQSPEMKSLRQFLVDTKDLQAVFIANRLEVSFAQMVEKCPQQQKKITKVFNLLAKDVNGLYALIDYLNFKGAGTSEKETYQGKGWGLLQVLSNMSEEAEKPLAAFVQSAKDVLSQRVKHSPPERNEGRWLKGWFNRLDSYLGP